MKMKRICLLGVTVAVLSIVIFGLTAGGTAAVSVVRDLPEDPVYEGDEIQVTLSQSGFFMDVGTVTELLPDGFSYSGIDPLSGGELKEYNPATNTLVINFNGVPDVTYRMQTGTASQIEDAVFSGTWKTLDPSGNILSGDVQGDTTLTLGTGPKPTPTPTPTPPPTSDGGGNGGGGGDGNGGAGTPTPSATTSPGVTPTPSTTVSPGVSPSPGASPGVTPLPSSSPTAGPMTSPSTSPTTKPGIPGFELIFSLAGLLAVTQWLRRRRN